jgi:hypothetical protein
MWNRKEVVHYGKTVQVNPYKTEIFCQGQAQSSPVGRGQPHDSLSEREVVMEQKNVQRPVAQKPPIWDRDRPGCIKYILLILLLLLLAAQIGAGDFNFAERNWLVWPILIIKLLLIALLIALIWVQRDLKCELTEPTGCTEEEPDPIAGKLIVRVRGTASGGAFGSYTLEVRKVGFPDPIPDVVSYPGGGASGTAPVVGGELGQIETTSFIDDAYEITLTVYPAWGGTPKTCTIIFNLLKTVVYINRMAHVQTISMAPVPDNPNPYDPAAELRTGAGPVAVGGRMTIAGSAYVYECPARKIKKYEIRYARVTAPGPEPPQPATGDPIPGDWPSTNRAVLFEYPTADHYQPWTRVGPAPINLINSWRTVTIGGSTFYKLSPGEWNSGAAGSGRYSMLLTVEDTTGVLYHDIQHVWLDNHPILGRIVKFQWKNPETDTWEDIPRCQDLSMDKLGTIRVLGIAWDPVIDEAWWTLADPLTVPNDNFGHYRLDFWKQFGGAHALTGNIPNRVPALPAIPPVPTPTDADAGVLAEWDLTTLDAGLAPDPYVPPPDPLLYRNESCTYTLQLYVTDTSVIPHVGTHYRYHQVPIKIVNDL